MTEAANLARLSAAATQGEWFTDTENSEGEYGIGPDTHSGFLVSVIYGPDGKSLFDPHNSDNIEVHEDYADEDGHVSAWDETSRRNAAFVVALVNLYRSGRLVLLPSVEEMAGGNTLPTEYVRWLSSIEVDVRVHDLTADEVARLVAALTERTDHA